MNLETFKFVYIAYFLVKIINRWLPTTEKEKNDAADIKYFSIGLELLSSTLPVSCPF